MRGQNNHRGPRGYFFNPLEDFDSIYIRQVKVQQDEEKFFLPNQVERLLPVVTDFAMTAPQPQPFGQHIDKALFVIDYQ